MEPGVMDWLFTNWDSILGIIAGIIAAASIIVRLTPTKVDDEIWFKILKFLELLSLNNKPVEKE